jgi:ribosomal protein S19
MQERFTSGRRRSAASLLGITLLALGAGLGCSVEPHEFGEGAGGATSTSGTTSSTSTGMGGQGGTGGGCSTPADCDDSNACTDDTCTEGACANTPVDVADTDACTVDACDPATGAISHDPDPAIDDGDACTTDACDSASGTISHDAVALDDSDACTDDSCDPAAGVMHMPTAIDDMDACTADSCDVMTGVANVPIDPNDSNACTADSCDVMLGVQNAAIDPNDDNACTADSCDIVLGVANVAIDPNDSNACTADSCDPMTGVANVAISPDDNNACTADSCDPANGVANIAIDPNDNNLCTTDSCDVVLGVQHGVVNPNDNNACTTDSCDPVMGIQNKPVALISDNNGCTTDTCNPANGQMVYTAVVIDDANGCTTDACSAQTGVISHTPVQVPSDNNPCTLDRCASVNNAPTYTYPASTVLFSDDFANNAKGWTLGTEWAIGPTMPSTGGTFGNDPPFDHTATSDNGVAGVVLGGNYGTALHGYYYLESPVINSVVPSGEVVLSFWRWLTSDYPSFVTNTVEVFNGSTWVNLWTSPGFPEINDQTPKGNGWTLVQYTLTPHVNANMKVRFGFNVASGGVAASGGWTVDDVSIENRTFPSDNNLCTSDSCNALTGGGTFVALPVTDNDACTTDACDSARSFTHTYTSGNVKVFTEGFTSNANGWTLGTEWAIGPTVQGAQPPIGSPDPLYDWTHDTTDNGIAGVVLGGNASTVVHSAYHLTSPVKPTAVPAGKKLYLSFDRWLNTDYPSFMSSTIEVFNGLTWVNIYTAASPGVFDSAWAFQQYDITAYSNANLQVRFGVAVGASGVYTVSSWNVDNFRLDYCP